MIVRVHVHTSIFLTYCSYDDKNPSALYEAASLPDVLVPVRLDIDIEGQKLRDTLTWNKNGRYSACLVLSMSVLLNNGRESDQSRAVC